MKEERGPRSTAALAVFLLFAAVLFSVTPTEASIPRGDVAGEDSASLQLHEYSLATSALTPCRFTFAEGVSLIDTEHAPRAFSLIGSETSRCERTYARNNPLKYVDPDGLDFIKFGNQTVEVYPGEVLFIQQSGGGEHTFTYARQGANGEVFGYDSTSYRNLEAQHDRMKVVYPDWTGPDHIQNDVTQKSISGRENLNSPENGAKVLGVVVGDRKVEARQLDEAASKVKMVWGGKKQLQCTDSSLSLAKSAGYGLKLDGIFPDVKTFRVAAKRTANTRVKEVEK